MVTKETMKLRTDCNNLGYSCRDNEGKYLSNTKLKNLIVQIGQKGGRPTVNEKNTLVNFHTAKNTVYSIHIPYDATLLDAKIKLFDSIAHDRDMDPASDLIMLFNYSKELGTTGGMEYDSSWDNLALKDIGAMHGLKPGQPLDLFIVFTISQFSEAFQSKSK